MLNSGKTAPDLARSAEPGGAAFEAAVTTGQSSRRTSAGPTRAEAAIEILQNEIVSGKLAPSAPLRLEQVAARLNMSVMPVRAALHGLEALGLVERSPRRGARVATFSVHDLRDTYEARLLIEGRAIRRAAENLTAEDEEIATQHLERYVEASIRGDVALSRSEHMAFHFTLYEAGGSEWLLRLIRPLWANAERYRTISMPGRGTLDSQREEHESILAACVNHNTDAASRLLHQHLALTANYAANHLGSGDLF